MSKSAEDQFKEYMQKKKSKKTILAKIVFALLRIIRGISGFIFSWQIILLLPVIFVDNVNGDLLVAIIIIIICNNIFCIAIFWFALDN